MDKCVFSSIDLDSMRSRGGVGSEEGLGRYLASKENLYQCEETLV